MEKSFKASSGYTYLVLEIIFLGLAISGFVMQMFIPAVILVFLFVFLAPGSQPEKHRPQHKPK